MSLIHISKEGLGSLKGELFNHFHRYWVSIPLLLWNLIWESQYLFLTFREVKQKGQQMRALPTGQASQGNQ